jgi:hypothetical protein
MSSCRSLSEPGSSREFSTRAAWRCAPTEIQPDPEPSDISLLACPARRTGRIDSRARSTPVRVQEKPVTCFPPPGETGIPGVGRARLNPHTDNAG